jgi:hypothetical protein
VVSIDLMVKVSRALKRLVTFSLCFPERECGAFDDGWIAFSRADLRAECMSFLGRGKERQATLVWNRHKIEFIADMNADDGMGKHVQIPVYTNQKWLLLQF